MSASCPLCAVSLPLSLSSGACRCPSCAGALVVQDKVSVSTILVLWILAEIPLSLLMPSAGLDDWWWWLRTAMSGMIGAAIWFVCSRATRVVRASASSP